jgi:hypothetical protein
MYRDPKEKAYASIETKQRDETVSLQAFPDFAIKVADLLG